MYSVEVEKDSVAPTGSRLTTFVVTFPRVVLAEIATHRLVYDSSEASLCERTADRNISKNSASSRAIPFERMVKKVMDDPYMPMWTLQQKGMQGSMMSDEDKIKEANWYWLLSRKEMIDNARHLHDTLGIHKQDCNRLLEPWQWVTQIVTSSCWDNFFALRCHEAAFPPFRKLARMMFLARKKSNPHELAHGEWHLPFDSTLSSPFRWDPPKLTGMPHDEFPIEIKRSAARCAWVSYENHEKIADDTAVLRTFNSLFASPPIHGSPLEHQAMPMPVEPVGMSKLRSNLRGWLQARKLVAGEETKRYCPTDEEIAKWNDVD